MRKMVELSGCRKENPVAEERGQESAKIRLKKARKRKKEGKKESEGREGKVQFKCSLERGGRDKALMK